MKERELREHAICSLCDRPVGHTKLPLFWRVTVERFGVDMEAVRRQQGLGMMLGGALAMHMGPDENLAEPVMDPVTITVCETCAVERALPVAELRLLETGRSESEREMIDEAMWEDVN